MQTQWTTVAVLWGCSKLTLFALDCFKNSSCNPVGKIETLSSVQRKSASKSCNHFLAFITSKLGIVILNTPGFQRSYCVDLVCFLPPHEVCHRSSTAVGSQSLFLWGGPSFFHSTSSSSFLPLDESFQAWSRNLENLHLLF